MGSALDRRSKEDGGLVPVGHASAEDILPTASAGLLVQSLAVLETFVDVGQEAAAALVGIVAVLVGAAVARGNAVAAREGAASVYPIVAFDSDTDTPQLHLGRRIRWVEDLPNLAAFARRRAGPGKETAS